MVLNPLCILKHVNSTVNNHVHKPVHNPVNIPTPTVDELNDAQVVDNLLEIPHSIVGTLSLSTFQTHQNA